MPRVFDNNQKLHIKVLEKRFFAVDKDAQVNPYTYTDPEQPNKKKDYVEVESALLTDEQVEAQLVNPTDTNEQAYLTEFNNDRVKLRAEFQATYDQLFAVGNGTGGMNTNEIVANIRFNAITLAFVLRVVNKMKMLDE